MRNRLTQLIICITLFGSQSALAELTGDNNYSLSLTYLTATDDEQETIELDFRAELSERTALNLAYQNIQVEEDFLIPDFAGNAVDAQVFDLGIEHWLASQSIGFGLSYNRWDDDNQLKNNDLIGSLFYQNENWLWAFDVIDRDLELALAVLVPEQGLRTFTVDNDALGFGVSVLYGGWESWLLSFAHQQFDYDERIVESRRFEQIQRLPYLSNNPLIEQTSSVGLGYLFESGQLASFDVSFDENLLAQSDSTTYAMSYSYPMNESLDLDLGIAHIDQNEETTVVSVGMSWKF